MAKKDVSRKITISINGKEVEDSLSGIGKEIGRLNRELRKTSDPAERQRLNNELKATKLRYKEINDEVRETPSLLSKIKTQLGPVGVAIAGAFSAQAVLNFANQVIDVVKLYGELRVETRRLTGLQGEMLNQAVGATKALSDTFGTDYKENLIAANTLTKQFGVSFETALETIEKGYLAGADVSGDMLNQIREYAPLMKEANLELNEMVALIAQTEKEGIFNDKGIDAIKEGMLRIREGTTATRDAMNALGIDTNKVYKDLQEGTTDYFDVMQMVSSKLSEVEEQSPEVGAAIADIFGGRGEDAGLNYLQSIKDIDLELNNLIDTSNEYVVAQQLEVDANRELNQALAELTETGSWWNVMLSNIKLSAGQALSATSAYIETNVSVWTKIRAALGDTDALAELSAQRGKELVENQELNNQRLAEQQEKNEKENAEKQAQFDKERQERKAQAELDNLAKLAERKAQAEEKRQEAEKARIAKEQEKQLEDYRIWQDKFDKEQLDRVAAFHTTKKEFEDQLALEKATSEQEKELIKAEQDYEKHLLDLEKLKLKEEEKAEIVKLIEEQKEVDIAKIRDKYNAEALANEETLVQNKLKLQNDILNGAIGLAGAETRIGQALLAVKGALAAKETLIQLGVLQSKAATSLAEGTLATAVGAANTAKVGFPQNIPLLIAFAAQAAGIISAIKGAIGATKSAKPNRRGYADGGYTSGLGYTDQSGHQVAGVVHADEYVVPKFITQDPVYADTIGFLEKRRLEGLGKGYADGGVVTAPNQTAESTMLINAIQMLNAQLGKGILATTIIGDDEIAKQKARENRLINTRESAKIK